MLYSVGLWNIEAVFMFFKTMLSRIQYEIGVDLTSIEVRVNKQFWSSGSNQEFTWTSEREEKT